MKVNSREQLRTQLRTGKLAPAYLLFGEEVYLRDSAANAITETALKDSSLREFNEARISLQNSSIETALAAAEQLPMMGEKRVVTVSEVIVSAVKGRDTISEDCEGVLERFLKDPPDSSVLIVVADEIDKRRKISKLLLNNAFSVEFKPLYDKELVSWAKDRARRLGVKVEQSVLWSLVALIGNDVRKLTIELEKLVTAALPDKIITEDLVESLAPNSRELSNFDLTDHLLAQKKSKAISTMTKILDDGAEPLMILGLLASNFHRLFLAKELMEEGVDRKEVARVCRAPYRQQAAFLESARRTERRRFSWALKRIAETDLAIKTSVGTPRLQIEMLICELAM